MKREPVHGQGVAVADDHSVADDGSADAGPEYVVGVVHEWSRYRCARHDRYPAGARRPLLGEGGPGSPGGGSRRPRPIGRAGPGGPRRHRSPRPVPVRGEGPLQAGGPGPQGRRRDPGRTTDRSQPPVGGRGADTQFGGGVGSTSGARGPALSAQPPGRRGPRRRRPRGQRGGPDLARPSVHLHPGPAGAPLGDRRRAGPVGHGAWGETVRFDVPPLPGHGGPADPGADRLRPRPPRRRLRGDPSPRRWS